MKTASTTHYDEYNALSRLGFRFCETTEQAAESWNATDNPYWMFSVIHECVQPSRQQRVELTCAVIKPICYHLMGGEAQAAFNVAEQYGNRLVTLEELKAANAQTHAAGWEWGDSGPQAKAALAGWRAAHSWQPLAGLLEAQEAAEEAVNTVIEQAWVAAKADKKEWDPDADVKSARKAAYTQMCDTIRTYYPFEALDIEILFQN
jgi:hypothetical protein